MNRPLLWIELLWKKVDSFKFLGSLITNIGQGENEIETHTCLQACLRSFREITCLSGGFEVQPIIWK